MSARTLALTAGVAAISVATLARAQTAVETRFFDDEARACYARGDYAGALAFFLLADGATPSSRSLYNIAVTADLAGTPGLAFVYLDEYLRSADRDAERRADATSRRAKLEARLALVDVASEPPGASIFVDGVEYGDYGATPRRVALEPGVHHLELALAGHHPARVDVTARRGATVKAEGALAPRTGTLLVSSEPPGATIELSRDGAPIAARFEDGRAVVPVGAVRVRAVADGRLPASVDVVVREGETSRAVVVTQASPQPTGRLLVATDGVVARVLVDGRAKAESPATLDGVPVGTHTVELEAEGFSRWKGDVMVREGKPTYLDVSLRKERR